MEINFDMYQGYFNCNIAWGDISTSISYDGLGLVDGSSAMVDDSMYMQAYNNNSGPSLTGPSTNGATPLIPLRHWEHIPISFYNSWAEETSFIEALFSSNDTLEYYEPTQERRPFIYDEDSRATLFKMNKNFDGSLENCFVEVHHPKDSLYTHGSRWNADSYTFPRDVAHPYMQNSGPLTPNFSVGVARPHIACFKMDYGKVKNMNHFILEPGPISLGHFYDGCVNAKWELNLYQFTPEWNQQFSPIDSFGVRESIKTMLSTELYKNDTRAGSYIPVYYFMEEGSLPMEINYEYPNNMVVPWLRDVSYMFANNGCWSYNHRIEIPPFITTASGMFANCSYDILSNASKFNFDFNYNSAVYRSWNGTGMNNSSLLLSTSYMFLGAGADKQWYSPDVSSFVYNGNVTNNTIILPERVGNTSHMFDGAVYNFDINFDSNIVQNSAYMFAHTPYFNGKVNWYNCIPSNELIQTDKRLEDASGMFLNAYHYNRTISLPSEGINNASWMFGWTGNYEDAYINFRVYPDSHVERDEDLYGLLTNIAHIWNYRSQSHEMVNRNINYDTLYNHLIFIPSTTNDTSSMFFYTKTNQTHYHDVYLDNESCINSTNMFYGTNKLTGNIYLGTNVGSEECHTMFVGSIDMNLPDDGYIIFERNSVNYWEFSGSVVHSARINAKYITFNECGYDARYFFQYSTINVDRMTFIGAFQGNSDYQRFIGPQREMFYDTFINVNKLAITDSAFHNGASMTFYGHIKPGEDIRRLDITNGSAMYAYQMFAECRNFTFSDGISIKDSCTDATGMFYNCQNMVFNRSIEKDGKIFDTDLLCCFENTFAECKNIWNDSGFPFEFVPNVTSCRSMFQNAHLNSFDANSFNQMSCHDYYYMFYNATIDSCPVAFNISSEVSNMYGMFAGANLNNRKIDITIDNPTWQYDIGYAFAGMSPAPKSVTFTNVKGWVDSATGPTVLTVGPQDTGTSIYAYGSSVNAITVFPYLKYRVGGVDTQLRIDAANGVHSQWNSDRQEWVVIESGTINFGYNTEVDNYVWTGEFAQNNAHNVKAYH